MFHTGSSSKPEPNVPPSTEVHQQEAEETSEHLQEEMGSVGTATTASSQTGSTGAISPSLSVEQRSPASEQFVQESPAHKSMPPTTFVSSPEPFHSPLSAPVPNPLGLPQAIPPSYPSRLPLSPSSALDPPFDQAISLPEHPQIPQPYMEQTTYHLPPERHDPHSFVKPLTEQQAYHHPSCSLPILAEPPVPLFDIISEIPDLSGSLIKLERPLPPSTVHLAQSMYPAPRGPCTSAPASFPQPHHVPYPHPVYHSPLPSATSYGSPSPPNIFPPLSPNPSQLALATMPPLSSPAAHPFSYPTSVQDPIQGGYLPSGFTEGILDQQPRFYPPHAVHPASRVPALPRASTQIHRATRPPTGL